MKHSIVKWFLWFYSVWMCVCLHSIWLRIEKKIHQFEPLNLTQASGIIKPCYQRFEINTWHHKYDQMLNLNFVVLIDSAYHGVYLVLYQNVRSSAFHLLETAFLNIQTIREIEIQNKKHGGSSVFTQYVCLCVCVFVCHRSTDFIV